MFNFNIRTDEQPGGGYSVVIVFEPNDTKEKAVNQAEWIAESLKDLGWEIGRIS